MVFAKNRWHKKKKICDSVEFDFFRGQKKKTITTIKLMQFYKIKHTEVPRWIQSPDIAFLN